ncbi:MAG: hypothetical protein WBG42_01985, partial [Cryomorphaceae bacterium]
RSEELTESLNAEAIYRFEIRPHFKFDLENIEVRIMPYFKFAFLSPDLVYTNPLDETDFVTADYDWRFDGVGTIAYKVGNAEISLNYRYLFDNRPPSAYIERRDGLVAEFVQADNQHHIFRAVFGYKF